MADKSIKRNYIYNVSYQILVIMTPLVTAPYISRVLGAESIGKVSYESSIASYFSMFAALGISSYGSREISYCQKDKRKRTETFWNLAVLRIICASVCTAAYLAYTARIRGVNPLCLMMAVHILASALDITWLFQGMEDFSRIVRKNVIFKLAGIIFIFLCVHTAGDLLAYAFGAIMIPAAGNVSLWFCIRTVAGRPELKKIRPFHNFGAVLSLFIPTIAVGIYTVLDKTIIGIMDSSGYENGCYEQAVKISKMILSLLTSLGTVMVPRIGFYYMQNDTESVRRYMYRSYRFVWFLGIPLCFGLAAVSDNLVPWFFGSGYGRVAVLIKILSPLILAIGVNNVTGVQYFIPTQRQGLFSATVFAGLAVNMALNVLLVPVLYSVGASAASVAAETAIAIIQLFLVRKELYFRDVIRYLPNYLTAGGLMYAAVRMENMLFYPSAVHTAIMGFSGASVYVLVLAILRDDFFLGQTDVMIARVKEIICKK